MFKIELSLYSRSMKMRIPNRHVFEVETQALTDERNRLCTTVDWQFRNADARIK
jgi:hypothetical protein